MKRNLLPLALCLLVACTTARPDSDPAAVLAGRLDTTVQQQAAEAKAVAQVLQTGKIRIAKGGVLVLQLGTGNSAAPQQTDNTKAGQRQGTAAVGDGTTASNQSKRAGGVPWYVYALAGAALIAAWEWLSHQLPRGWLRWRVQT